MHHTHHMHHVNTTAGPTGGGMPHGMPHGPSHGMKMYFHFSKEVVILFEGWKIDSVGGIVGSMIALFLLGVLYEGLKIGREALKRREFLLFVKSKNSYCNGKAAEAEAEFMQPKNRLISPLHFLQTFLHMLQVFLGYLLMLAFMTYNAWICIAVILGAGLGYYLFGWHRTSILELGDHCL